MIHLQDVSSRDYGSTMARKRETWGGARSGAGKKAGPPGLVRRNHVVVLLTDAEFKALGTIAREEETPIGTAAHEIIARSLARRGK